MLTSYFKDRPMIPVLLDKDLDVMVSEVTGLSILKIIANNEPDFMKSLLTQPRLVVQFGKAINEMAKNDGLGTENIRLALDTNGDVFIGDEVDRLERELKNSGAFAKIKDSNSSYIYETLLDIDDAPDVSLRDIDIHLEGQA